jgi:hypothetical protein
METGYAGLSLAEQRGERRTEYEYARPHSQIHTYIVIQSIKQRQLGILPVFLETARLFPNGALETRGLGL